MAKSPSKRKPASKAADGSVAKKNKPAATKPVAAAKTPAAKKVKAVAKRTTPKKAPTKKSAAKNTAAKKTTPKKTTPKTTSTKATAPKARNKPGPKPGTKHGAITAAGKPRKKPGPKPGTKHGKLTAAGKPRKKPGPKPKAATVMAKKPAATKVIKKTATQKVAPKKAAAIKAKSKTPVKAKKLTTAKSVAAKKVAVTTLDTQSPATPQKTSQPETVAKTPVQTPVAAPQSTLSSREVAALRVRVDNIQSRMKTAESESRKEIKALETAFRILEKKLGNNTNTQQLSSQVSMLSDKVAAISKSANKDISATLSTALNNSTVEDLTKALTVSEDRLAQAEATQAESIARINRHIADMATAIDKRFRRESEMRNLAITDLRRDAFERIASVESQSAKAITELGEKVIAVSDKFGERASGSEDIIKEKVSEIALKTQSELEQYSATLERRINALENEQRQASKSTDQAIMSLSNRLEGVEYIAATPESAAQAPYPVSVPTPTPAPIADATTEFDDAFSPTPIIQAGIVPPNPYAAPEPTADLEPRSEHVPAEFDPRDLSPVELESNTQIPAPLSQSTTPMIATSALAFDTPVPEAPALESVPLPTEPDMPAPYADPAYAEIDSGFESSMNSARPGNFGSEKKKFNFPPISRRNLQVAGIALAVGIVGIVGIKTFTGGPDKTNAPSNVVADNSMSSGIGTMNTNVGSVNPSMSSPVFSESTILETTPTIGQYADNQVNIAPATSEGAITLQSAVQAGNPVAQFQLGVSYLDNGNTAEAVQLIRAAADQGQPAAQYRLAKLYETGEGVTLNAEMARKLTERAARNGNRIAMHDLALYHAEGRGGVSTDLDLAAKWFEKAADRGVVDSQFNLGVMFETGKGVPKNINTAYVWYGIAAAQGDQFAKQRINFLKDQVTPEEKLAAETRIANFSPSKIDQAANGIFKNLPWAAKKKAKPADNGQVKEVQVMLEGLGFDIGGADGAIGPKTRTAIMTFEKANGLPETGRVNDELLDRLRFASGA